MKKIQQTILVNRSCSCYRLRFDKFIELNARQYEYLLLTPALAGAWVIDGDFVCLCVCVSAL